IEKGIGHVKGAQKNDLESSRGEMLAQIGELKDQYFEDLCDEFKEALELYVEPQGTWSVPIIKILADKKEMDYEKKEGDVEKVVIDFLTSKDKLTSDDKRILEIEANKFLISKDKEPLIKAENQLTLEDINVLNVAANQFLALKDQNALKLLEMAMNEFLESSKYEFENIFKNIILNFLGSPFVLENKLSLESKLALGHQITAEDINVLEKASKNEDFEKTAKELLNLKAKEVLETAVNDLLTLKRKRVLLILGSGGTGKSTFNRHLARLLWEKYQLDLTQSIPLFIALAPLEKFINQNLDFIAAYLQEKGNLSPVQINELRNRKFVFILDGYDEIAERDRHCYNSNMFSEWKNAKIIISCRPEYLNQGDEEMFWPKENGKRGFQELTLTPFSRAEVEQYIKNYVRYFKKSNSLLWDADEYIRSIDKIPQLEDLVCNPILLKITLTVLPGIFIDRETTSQINQINRKVLYDEFLKKWFERAQNRLNKIQLKLEERKEFDHLNNDFTEHCLQFGKEFAFKMFVDNNKVVVNRSLENLEDTNVKCRLMRFSMPLIQRGNQYWFFHKSLRDYLIACALLDSLNDTSQLTLFNKQSIIPEPAIQTFLVEGVQQMPEYKQPMLNFIEYSKNNANIQIASTNAITVLTRAKIPLSINLDSIRIQGANLSYADLQNANFKNATLQDANLQNANLQYANLQ
ncbi:26601_t:CDS:2, partial [Racocetra persica]